jgi:H+/Na+-translocating ferredoxin:NAD+ oxidoreductase subunit G
VSVAPPSPSSSGAAAAWPMLRAMVGIGLLCGLLIVSVYVGTGPTIERRRADALQRAIFQVLPEATSSRSFRRTRAGRFERVAAGASGGARVHAGYDADGRLVGLAVPAEGMGYQDVIRLLWGYSFERDAIVGIRVLESRETPGLGDRIESDPDFLANFERLDVTLAADGSALAHPIEVVKHGAKQHPWQVDGITGATISSGAVARILRESASSWVPALRAHQGDFRAED